MSRPDLGILEHTMENPDDPLERAAYAAYYGIGECPLDDADCMPTPEPAILQWWSSSELLDAHYAERWWDNTQDYRSLCGVRFTPFLEAPGIRLQCDVARPRGACIVCLDRVLLWHRRDCPTRGCRVVELLEERDRGIFR